MKYTIFSYIDIIKSERGREYIGNQMSKFFGIIWILQTFLYDSLCFIMFHMILF